MCSNLLFRIKAIILLFVMSITNNGFSQVQLNEYPYSDPEWTYLEKWVDWFQSPPVTSYSFLTCKKYGDTVRYGKQYMKIGTSPLMGPNAFNYYHKSNDTLFHNIFGMYDSTNYVWADYSSSVGDAFSDNNDTVRALSTYLLLDGQSKLHFKTESPYGPYFDTIIEDIGSLHIPWFAMAYTTIVPTQTLVCFKNGNDVLYYVPVNFTHNSITYVNPCSGLITSAADMPGAGGPFIFASFNSNELTIENNSSEENLMIDIMDIQGRMIERKSMEGKRESIILRDVVPGIYFYSVYNSQRRGNGKFLILAK
jgi:hypothetical protein